MNWMQGCIQLDTGLGIERRHRHNGYIAIKEASACNIERNKGWNPQVPGLLTRWPGGCVVVQSSCDGHITEYSTQGLMGISFQWGFWP